MTEEYPKNHPDDYGFNDTYYEPETVGSVYPNYKAEEILENMDDVDPEEYLEGGE